MTTPDLALLDGRVRTLDLERPSAPAIAISGGEIVRVGSDTEVRALCGPHTSVVELAEEW